MKTFTQSERGKEVEQQSSRAVGEWRSGGQPTAFTSRLKPSPTSTRITNPRPARILPPVAGVLYDATGRPSTPLLEASEHREAGGVVVLLLLRVQIYAPPWDQPCHPSIPGHHLRWRMQSIAAVLHGHTMGGRSTGGVSTPLNLVYCSDCEHWEEGKGTGDQAEERGISRTSRGCCVYPHHPNRNRA